MVTNEIRRLIRSLVEASNESLIEEKEIIELVRNAFSEKVNTPNSEIDKISTFRIKAQKALSESEFGFEQNSLFYLQAVDVVCIAYELRAKSYKLRTISEELSLRESMTSKEAYQLTKKIVPQLKIGLVEKQLYSLSGYGSLELSEAHRTLPILISYIESL